MTPIQRGLAVCAFFSCFASPALAEEILAPSPAATSGPRAFTSLTQAVAAQDADLGDEALRCLASAVFFESRGEPLAGQLAVAQVILNRATSGRYPTTTCGVITQRGQFGFVRRGVIPAVNASHSGFRTAVAVAKVAMARAWVAEQAATAMFFNGVRAARVGTRRIATIGNHAFYR